MCNADQGFPAFSGSQFGLEWEIESLGPRLIKHAGLVSTQHVINHIDVWVSAMLHANVTGEFTLNYSISHAQLSDYSMLASWD